MTRNPRQIRSISVADWHTWTLEGNDLPVTVFLSGDSMRPLIRRNRDAVTILPLRRPVRRGDIVLIADENGRYVVHRIWKHQNGRIQTIGDHCIAPDSPITPDNVWGLVIRVQRGNWKLPLDNQAARSLGRIWMTLLPLRKCYYRMRNRGKVHEIQ